MPRVPILALLVVACAGGAPPPAEPPPAPAPEPESARRSDDPLPDLERPDVSADRALLPAGPPPAGPVTKLFQALAANAGAGVVRCPLAGGGRATVVRGRSSDHSVLWGIPVDLEDGLPPWSPALDVAGSDGEWATFLAVPGSTVTTVSTRSRSLRYVHPPVEPGKTVTCSAVEPGGDRIVRGHVAAPRPPGLLVMPCLARPPAVGDDGTFAARVPTPCRLWVESGGERSEVHEVGPGNGPLDLEFHLVPDPMQADGGLTAEGRTRILAFLQESAAADKSAGEWVDAARAADKDPGVQAVTNVLLNGLRDRQILNDKAQRTLTQ